MISEELVKRPPLLSNAEYNIDLQSETEPSYGSLYPMLSYQLCKFQKYIDENLFIECIQYSTSSTEAPILFISKSDGSLRLYMDYQGLNHIIIKNRYPLPLVDDLIDCLGSIKYFSKIDLRDAYHRIRIKESDQ